MQGLTLKPGLRLYKRALDRAEQEALLADLREIFCDAPLFRPVMPRSGKAFSVRMSNCGDLGWVSDLAGYRYQKTHPETGRPWPAMPDRVLRLWREFAEFDGDPDACLINYYDGAAKMGAHQDRDETDFSAPIVSVSLGDSCRFRFGGGARKGPTQSLDAGVPETCWPSAAPRERCSTAWTGLREPRRFFAARPDQPDLAEDAVKSRDAVQYSYSPPMWAPFSATERFIKSTTGVSASITTAISQKQSK